MPTEVEAKFLATEEALDQLARAEDLGPAKLGPMRTLGEVDRYLDTADGRLAAGGWACRLRRRRDSTRISLKGPPLQTDDDLFHRRLEVEGPATDATDPTRWPASEARDLLERHIGDGTLVELVVLEQQRGERTVELDGSVVAMLSLDRVTARRHASVAPMSALHVVELEAQPGIETDALAELVGILTRWPGLVADTRTKLEHALAARA